GKPRNRANTYYYEGREVRIAFLAGVAFQQHATVGITRLHAAGKPQPSGAITQSHASARRARQHTSTAFSRPRDLSSAKSGLLAELADLLGEAGDLAARGPPMDHAALGGPHELRLGRLQGRLSLPLVAARDGVLDQAEVAPHARAPRLVDLGTAGNLAGRLLGGLR